MILLVLAVLIVSVLSIGFVTTRISLVRYSSIPWRALLENIENVDVSGIGALAEEYLHPDKTHEARSEGEKLRLVGGTEGLARMRHNADVMIAMAVRAEEWDPEGATQIGELMRRDANKIKSAIVGQGLGRAIGYGKHRVGSYVTEASGAYSLMLQRLVRLYERGHGARLVDVEEAASLPPRQVERNREERRLG